MHPEISKGRENKSTDAGLIKHKATLWEGSGQRQTTSHKKNMIFDFNLFSWWHQLDFDALKKILFSWWHQLDSMHLKIWFLTLIYSHGDMVTSHKKRF
jgi:hypothetical protein